VPRGGGVLSFEVVVSSGNSVRAHRCLFGESGAHRRGQSASGTSRNPRAKPPRETTAFDLDQSLAAGGAAACAGHARMRRRRAFASNACRSRVCGTCAAPRAVASPCDGCRETARPRGAPRRATAC
jgi:hypothetical protein